jgi:hypothetical protein
VASGSVTGVSYGGVSLTVGPISTGASGNALSMWYLIGATVPSGTNTIVLTRTVSAYSCVIVAASYKGVGGFSNIGVSIQDGGVHTGVTLTAICSSNSAFVMFGAAGSQTMSGSTPGVTTTDSLASLGIGTGVNGLWGHGIDIWPTTAGNVTGSVFWTPSAKTSAVGLELKAY